MTMWISTIALSSVVRWLVDGPGRLALEIIFYIGAGLVVMRRATGMARDALFAVLNLAVIYLVFFRGSGESANKMFAVYVGLVLAQYIALRLFAEKKGSTPWLAFFAPILALIAVRYGSLTFWTTLKMPFPPAFYLVGISYLAFRCSRLVLEVRNGQVAMPGLFRYIGFCFFVPTMAVGPINPYSNYQRAFAVEPPAFPLGRALLRILVGGVKYVFLGSLCFQLSYANLLQDNHYHHWIDLPVAAIAYYLFLYCNFSGFCDMAIGGAGLIGFPVEENFSDPIAARNLKDFWNRWHITLSQYMRDVVFTPLSRWLAGFMGPKNINHAVALTIVTVFLLVGIWHGVGWNYAAFGAAHALGFVIHHYYTIGLKSWLGREGFKAYNANRWIHAAAVVITFLYCAATFFLFANTIPEMKEIFSVMR